MKSRQHLQEAILAVVFASIVLSAIVVVPTGTVAQSADEQANDSSLGTPELGETDSTEFSTEIVVDDLNQPITMTFLPNGRMLVLQKDGNIAITDPSTPETDSQTYMSLSNIDTSGERGLVGIALDPNFEQNGQFYLYYQAKDPAKSRVSRFQHVENSGGLSSRGDNSSEIVIWQDSDTYDAEYHFGGGLDFGPNGLLYLTVGEEFNGTQSQDLTTSGGKVHRFDTDGSVPSDNPYVDDPDALDTIWATGLRNPFRAKWDRQTERYFIGDVGGNVDDSVEEINLGQRGANYGWPNCEGPCNGYTDPIYSYPHREQGGSVVAGPVYHGDQYPNEYTNAFFFADYVFNEIRYLTFDDSGQVTGNYLFRNVGGRPVDLREGSDGALYYTRLAYGNVKRIEYDAAISEPSVTSASANKTNGTVPFTVEFSGDATDADGDSLTYTWEFGDDTTATGKTVTHTYNKSGTFQARLFVTDESAEQDASDPIEITAGAPPSVTIDKPAPGRTFRAGDTIKYSGSATNAQSEPIPPENLSWTIEFTHNTHTHPVLGPESGTSGSFDIGSTGHDYHSDTGYRLTLSATDAQGVSNSTSINIAPEKVNLTLDSDPAGVNVSLDGVSYTTPIKYDTMIGFQHAISAPKTTCVEGTSYEFDSWSDGGNRIHDVTIPETDTKVTASYVATGVCGDASKKVSVHITEPANGTTLSGENLTVSWESTNATEGDQVNLTLDDQAPISGQSTSGNYTFTGLANGSHTVEVEVTNETYAEYGPNATESVTVTIEVTANDDDDKNAVEPICTDCNAPKDLDGDGKYEDVNGNNIHGFGDVVTLFNNLRSESVTKNSELYDYNNNGVVGFGDVIYLFKSI